MYVSHAAITNNLPVIRHTLKFEIYCLGVQACALASPSLAPRARAGGPAGCAQRQQRRRPAAAAGAVTCASEPELPAFTGLTALVFRSPAARVEERDGYRRLVATAPLAEGALILCEQVVCAGRAQLCYALSANGLVYDALAPRGPRLQDAGSEAEREAAAAAKLDSNVFTAGYPGLEPGQMRDLLFVGLHLSAVNHGHRRSACVTSLRLRGTPATFAALTALRPIAAGEEITIDYGPAYPAPYVRRGGGNRRRRPLTVCASARVDADCARLRQGAGGLQSAGAGGPRRGEPAGRRRVRGLGRGAAVREGLPRAGGGVRPGRQHDGQPSDAAGAERGGGLRPRRRELRHGAAGGAATRAGALSAGVAGFSGGARRSGGGPV